MIEIANVKPTAAESRPLRFGWGWLHWAYCLPYVVYIGGILTLASIAAGAGVAGDGTRNATALTLLAILILSSISHALVRDAGRAASAKAPGAGLASHWTFSEAGLALVTSGSKGFYDWAIIKGVKEEKDRFVFLMTPSANPVLPKRCLSDDQLQAFAALLADLRASGRLGAGVDYVRPPSDKA